jgi:putative membrane protein
VILTADPAPPPTISRVAEPRTDRRWPRQVYGVGDEPDPRFSFANERTFLAWIRTALGFVAAGVALAAVARLGVGVGSEVRAASLLLVAAGLLCGVGAFTRWMRNERAMRLDQPLPSSRLLVVLTALVVLAAVAALAVVAGA